MIRSLSLLITLGFIWGSGYSIARYAMTHGVSPLGYALWQSSGPALVLLLLTLRQWRIQWRRLLKFWPYYLVTAILGIAIPNTNMYFAASHLPAGLVAVIVNTVPLMVYPLALLTKQEHFHYGRMFGVLCGILGIMIIVMPDLGVAKGLSLHWLLFTFLTPLSFALCVIFIVRYRPPDVDDLILSSGMLLIAALLLAPLVIQQQALYPLHFPYSHASNAVLLEIILSSIGYVLFFKLIKTAGAVFYSLVSAVVCLTGLFWGWLFFNESLTISLLLAVLLIVLAISLVSWQWRSAVGIKESS